MGLCFRTLGNYTPFCTRDEINAARYHQQDPNNMIFVQFHPLRRFCRMQRQWRKKEFGEPMDPWEAISNTSISFHLVKDPIYMRRIDTVLYPNGPVGNYCAKRANNSKY